MVRAEEAFLLVFARYAIYVYPTQVRNATLLSVLTLLLISFWIYLPVKGFDYLAIDDAMHTEGNPKISPLTFENVSSFWKEQYENAYTPITYTVWAFLAHIGKNTPDEQIQSKTRMNPEGNKFKPGVFHLGNLIIHCGTVVVLFFLLRILALPIYAAFFGTLLFAVHPLQVETVCWITGLRDVLAGLFSFLCIFLYLKYINSENTKFQKNLFYAGAFASFFIGVLCKSSALMAPFISALLAFVYFKRKPLSLVLDFIPWVILISPVMKVFFGLNDSVAMRVVYKTPFPERFLVAGDAVTFYLEKLIFPLNLTMDYGRTPQLLMILPERFLTGLLPLFMGIASLVLYFKKGIRWPIVCFGIFVLGLGPVLGITPFIFQHISTTADRYVYLSFLGASIGLSLLVKHFHSPKQLGFVTLLLLVFFFKSYSQVGIWKNNLTLFAQTLEQTPQSWLASNDLGTVFEGMGRFDTAMSLYERSGEIANIPSAWNNAGAMAIELKDYGRAYEFFDFAIKSSNGSSWAYHNLGAAYLMGGLKEKGMEQYKIASSRDDRYKDAHKNPKILRKDDGKKNQS